MARSTPDQRTLEAVAKEAEERDRSSSAGAPQHRGERQRGVRSTRPGRRESSWAASALLRETAERAAEQAGQAHGGGAENEAGRRGLLFARLARS